MSRFGIIVRDNQSSRAERADLGTEAYGLRLSTVLPGGCNACTFRVAAPIRFVPTWLGINYEVRLRDAQGVFWSGRMEQILPHRSAGGEYWEVTALGFAVNLDDQLYTAQDVAGLETSAIAGGAITNLTQQIAVSTVTPTGFTLSAVSAVSLRMLTAKTVITWAARYADTSNTPFLWYVYPQNDGDTEFTFAPRPSTPDLDTFLDDMDLFEGGFSVRRLANRVIVEYNAGASTLTVNDSALQGSGPTGWGFVRTAYLYLPEITQSADATQAANALLEAASNQRLAARAITMTPGARFFDRYGAPVAPWRVRSGLLMHIDDIIGASQGIGTLSWNNAALIAGTEYDEDSQVLTIVPENHELTLDQIVAQVSQLFRGRHTTARGAS